ncbi:myo-inosose-2 dehydratase [Pelagibacteraceae bacterium]|nr:myo-inosose-2 dehydratase [Pelagibacteraceae bacterium]
MSIKIGVSPIAWSNDDFPELGGDTTLEQCLKETNEIGFSGIEAGGKFPKKSSELIPKLEKENLKLCSGWYGANLLKNSVKEELSVMKEQLDLFKECDAPCIVFAEVTGSVQGEAKTPLSKRPILNKEEWKTFYYKINEISKYMEDSDMPLAYHHHMGTVVQSQEDTERLIDNTSDTVKLLIDTGHMMFAGGDFVKIAKDYSSRLHHIHCKDIRKDVLKNSLKNDLSFIDAFFAGAFTVPGDGCINYETFLKLLKDFNYNGWLVVEAEQDPRKANPLEYGKIGFNHLKKIALNCGFDITR